MTRVTREFDPVLVGALAHVIYGGHLHEHAREDTIGVLLYYGAFHAEADEAKRDGFIADLTEAIDAHASASPLRSIFGKEKAL